MERFGYYKALSLILKGHINIIRMYQYGKDRHFSQMFLELGITIINQWYEDDKITNYAYKYFINNFIHNAIL